MSLLEILRQRARRIAGRIAYPEPEDDRIMQAVRMVADRDIARPVLVGRAASLPADVPPGVEVEIIDDSPRLEQFATRYAERRGIAHGVARRLISKPLAYAGMMVSGGHVHGMVAGIAHSTGSVLQAAALTIGYREGLSTPSSCFIMIVPHLRGEQDVPLIFADCAVTIEPTEEELADIALASAQSARLLLGICPRVAMLSFSTARGASHALVDKVRRAAELAGARIKDGYVEGELQLDAAVNPDVAAQKGVAGGEVAGKANVLIFPDLNSGNICYKAVNQLGGARAIGPVLQGFAKPVSDLSRGASVEDVVATTVVTVLQAAEEG